MMDCLFNFVKIKVFELFEELKDLMCLLYNKYMDDIIFGYFFSIMMVDWVNDDKDLFGWCVEIVEMVFENYLIIDVKIVE